MEFKKDKTNGYMYAYNPTHPCANKSGKVAEHVYVMWLHIGRLLHADECVHHIDRNRDNNKLSNLLLMTNSAHAELHQREDNNIKYIEYKCFSECCSNIIRTTESKKRKFCSISCYKNSPRKMIISKAELEKMIWSKPMTHISKELGISDVAISKKCKKYGIEKPPIGYWLRSK